MKNVHPTFAPFAQWFAPKEQPQDPQPALTEAELLAGDLERDRRKAEKAHERNDRAALDVQVQRMRENGAL